MTATDPPGALGGHHDGADDGEQIFVDASGRRKKWLRRAAIAVCVPLATYLGLLATGVVSSSPLGTPPWIAEQPAGGGNGNEKNPANEANPSGSAKPGGAGASSTPKKSPRPSTSPATQTSAPAASTDAAIPPPTTAPPGQASGPPTVGTTAGKPGNGPSLPPGQSNRPTAPNTNKGGH